MSPGPPVPVYDRTNSIDVHLTTAHLPDPPTLRYILASSKQPRDGTLILSTIELSQASVHHKVRMHVVYTTPCWSVHMGFPGAELNEPTTAALQVSPF